MSEKKVIQIIKGKEYQARRDDVRNKDIFFADSYAAARDCVYDIIEISEAVKKELIRERQSEKWSDKWSDFIAQLSENPNQDLRGQVNNIIAFCADRGQGKTTAMRSFSRELKNCTGSSQTQRCPKRFPECQGPTQGCPGPFRGCPGYSEDQKNLMDQKNFWTKGPLPNMHFIECIDPTMMSKNDTIIKVVLSRMFNRVSQMEKERDKGNARIGDFGGHRVSLRDQEKLLEQFQKCFHDAEILSGETHHEDWRAEDDLEKMAELGDSSHLLASMCRLIYLYLDYMGSHEDYLVIQIDDADMQISKTFEILDDIRRYLLLPNVIILIAANMTQLESTVEQHFLEEYKTSVNTPGSMGNVEYCHNVATLFLEKILPSSRRIFLPRLEDHWEELFVEYKEPQGNNLLPDPKGEDWRIEKQLLNYLHRKTGMVFLKPQNHYHDFLPTNIRELTHFLAYFSRMDDLDSCYEMVLDIFNSTKYDKKEAQDKIAPWEMNLDIFQDYLIHLWPGTNLREPSRKLFMQFVEESLFNKHDFLLRSLPDYYGQERVTEGKLQGIETKNKEAYCNEFIWECQKRGVEIPKTENSGERRISSGNYADAMTALSVLEDLPSSSRQAKFIYAIRLYYSICLHQIMLKRLKHLDQKPASDQNLTYFMRDGFLKNVRENNRYENFAFWRIYIPKPQTSILKGNGVEIIIHDIETNKNYKQIFRRRITNGVTVWTCPVQTEQSWYDIRYKEYTTEGFVFHPFYGLLYELDKFTYSDQEAYDKAEGLFPTEASRLRMKLAFVISLNWDVQYNLFSLHWSFEAHEGEPLGESLGNLYSKNDVKNFLCEITEQNRDLQWIESLEDFDFLQSFTGDLFDNGINLRDLNISAKTLESFSKEGSTLAPKFSRAISPSEVLAKEFLAAMIHAFEEIQKISEEKEDAPSTVPTKDTAPSEKK